MASFSKTLQKLLRSKQRLSLQSIIDGFAQKSFAILFLLLLAIPALPLPTGGVTHIFEIIAMLLALELIAGRKTVWLPKSWLDKPLPKGLQTTALPKFIRFLTWIEKFSRPRLSRIQNNAAYQSLNGAIILVFTLFAFLAPPFTGLDTLPSLGVVIMALAMIFDDILLSITGVIVGSIGIGIIFFAGELAFQLL